MRLGVAVALVACAACSVSVPSTTSGTFACTSDSDCNSNFGCGSDGLCHAKVTTGGATTLATNGGTTTHGTTTAGVAGGTAGNPNGKSTTGTTTAGTTTAGTNTGGGTSVGTNSGTAATAPTLNSATASPAYINTQGTRDIGITVTATAGSYALAGYACSTDAGVTYQSCDVSGQSPTAFTFTYGANFVDGTQYILYVRAVDTAGQHSNAIGVGFTADFSPPTLDSISNNGATPTSLSAILHNPQDLTSGVASYLCQIDTGSFTACTPQNNVLSFTFTNALQDGTHTLSVKLVDGAGNVSQPYTLTWTQNTAGPQLSVTYPAVVQNNNVTFSVTCSESPCSLQCSVDGAALTACTAPINYSNLTGRVHNLTIKATDQASRSSSFGPYTWTSAGEWAGAGDSHSCAIDPNGTMFCTGSNDFGQLGNGTSGALDNGVRVQVGGGPVWASVATGAQHTCGLQTSGSLWCWGSNANAQLAIQAGGIKVGPVQVGSSQDWSMVSAGNAHTCAIAASTGILSCWGDNSRGQLGSGNNQSVSTPTAVSSSLPWVQVSAGAMHTCAVRSDAAVFCWGANDRGQLGLGSTTDTSAPMQIGSLSSIRAVAAGVGHSCAVSTANTPTTLWCWGDNTFSQLGGTVGSSFSSTPVSTASNWQRVSAGNGFTCGVDNNQALLCLGSNRQSQLGQNNLSNYGTPTRMGAAGNWVGVFAGAHHACGTQQAANGLQSGCWGSQNRGQLGNGNVGRQIQFGKQTTLLAFGGAPGNMAAGGDSTCGIVTSPSPAALYCWGDNTSGQLGFSTSQDAQAPQESTTPGSSTNGWAQVSLGSAHACGVYPATTGPNGYCWGTGPSGELGTGASGPTFLQSASASYLLGSSSTPWLQAVAGSTASCGIEYVGSGPYTNPNGNVFCWGDNSYFALGQLDNSASPNSFVPLQVIDGSDGTWTSLVMGDQHVCGIDNGNAMCWGFNTSGQLGTGLSGGQSYPSALAINPHGNPWRVLSAGTQYACGLDSQGYAMCWGDNTHGELGTGDNINHVTPQSVLLNNQPQPGWSAIAAGPGQFTCGIHTNTLYCWGNNGSGQLGVGTRADVNAPTTVDNSYTWVSVVVGNTHACAMESTNSATYCWGDNLHGQLGNGLSSNTVMSTLAP